MLLAEITKTGAGAAAGLLIGIGLVFLIRPETHQGAALLLIVAVLTVTVASGLIRLVRRNVTPPPGQPPL